MFVTMNIKTNCCENMSITCFASCLEMWDVIWEMRFKFIFCLKLFETIHFRDHAWSFHRKFCWSSSLIFDEWRILILDYRMTYICFRFIERRMFILDLSNDVYNETLLNLTRHFIKLIVSDSSNLTKTIYQTWWVKTSFYQIWRKRLIKLDEKNVILSNRMNASSHQIFEKKDNFSIFWWASFCNDIWCEKLSLAKDFLLCENKCLCEIVMISERF